MKKILFMAIIASSMFACNKDDHTDSTDPTGQNTVTLTVTQEAVSTKGVDNQKGATEYAVIGSARIYFLDGTYNKIYQRELTTTEIAALANTTLTPGNKTVTISGVPNNARYLYFMANVQTAAGAGYPAIEGSTGADARLRIDKLQADVTHAPMSGLSVEFVGLANPYTTSVTLTPIVARLEVGQITCENENVTAVDADIKEYKLAGVFINYVRPYVLLDGTPYLAGGSYVDIRTQTSWNSNWAVYFAPSNDVFPYYTGGSVAVPSSWVSNAMVTYCTPTGNAALSFYPDVTNGASSVVPPATPKLAWAYQLCPSTTVTGGQPADVPHIILKLTNIAYVSDPLGLQAATKYVTVTKYKDASGPVLEFKKGNVYRIENLIFSHNQATDQPYQQNVTVTATVSVEPWKINPLTPDWTN